MIYLIDDKRSRQKDFGWTEERFTNHVNLLTPLYTIDDVTKIGDELYNDNNIILYHESFLDFTNDKSSALKQREKLANKALKNRLLSVSFFSGSQSSRSLIENIAHLPVAILYRNLEVLVQHYDNNNESVKYLLFGENYQIEQKFDEILTDANKNIEKKAVIIPGTNLFIRPNSRYIQNAIEGAKEVTIFQDVSDERLSQKVNEWLNEEEYDNIFIPLCFGQTLSDFNGLRLAAHIRCTETPNQLKRIYIYSFVGIEYLLQNEYFNILKSKNVELVGYNKNALQHAASLNFTPIRLNNLPKEIKKLELQPPKNYLNDHSIANEWAIHQWAKTIGCDETDELTKVFQSVQSNLYFKYLKVVNPISEQDKISTEKLKIDFEGKPKVLLVEDEIAKGWGEIFAHLLYDLNNIDIDYLGYDFKNCSSDEIIRQTINKIEEDDIDVVILDFRLNQSDFENKDIKEITSIKILNKIKEEVNPGIQVIIFSATNKVWNFQALSAAGADSFILKDGGENINQSIVSLLDNLKSSIEKSLWLKPILSKTKSLINHLTIQGRKKVIDVNFAGAISAFLELSFDALDSDKNKFSFDSAFMYYFLILETISKQVVDEDNAHKVTYTNSHKEVKEGYKFQFRSSYDFLKDYEGNAYMQVAIGEDLISSNKRVPYGAKFHNLISYSGIQEIDPLSIVKLRNDFNHPNLIKNKRTAVIKKENVESLFEVCYKLIMNF